MLRRAFAFLLLALVLGSGAAKKGDDKAPEGSSNFCKGAIGANRRMLATMKANGEC